MNSKESMANLALQGQLISMKNKYYSEIDQIVWDKRKQFPNWEAKIKAIEDIFISVHQQMLEYVDKSGLK